MTHFLQLNKDTGLLQKSVIAVYLFVKNKLSLSLSLSLSLLLRLPAADQVKWTKLRVQGNVTGSLLFLTLGRYDSEGV